MGKRKPYGWHYATILYNVAGLFARGKLEVRLDSNLLDGDELLKALTNSRNHANIILEPQFDSAQAFVREQEADFSSCNASGVDELRGILTNPECFRGAGKGVGQYPAGSGGGSGC